MFTEVWGDKLTLEMLTDTIEKQVSHTGKLEGLHAVLRII